MIITCPSCSTQYDVDSGGFKPDGRSVLCAVCEESWFVPAPAPVGDFLKAKKAPSKDAEKTPAPPVNDSDDSLFDDVDIDHLRQEARAAFSESDSRGKGPGDFLARHFNKAETGPASDEGGREEALLFGDADDDKPDTASHSGDEADANADVEAEEEPLAAPDRSVMDADFEDVDDAPDGETEAGFGRRIRDRRSTALTRVESIDDAADRLFNEDTFKALRVQPKELEKALRKARRRAESREKNRLTPLRALGWALWAGVVAATGFVVYTYREDIVNHWPNASAAYAVIGIDAEPDGLKIETIGHRVAMSTLGPTIEVTGQLINDSEKALPAPLMQAEALGAGGVLLSRWTFALDVSEISAGDSAEFMTRSPAPDGVAEIVLTFAPAPNPAAHAR